MFKRIALLSSGFSVLKSLCTCILLAIMKLDYNSYRNYLVILSIPLMCKVRFIKFTFDVSQQMASPNKNPLF